MLKMTEESLRNLETEKSIIGNIVNLGHLIKTALAAGVTSASFSLAEHAEIFATMSDMARERVGIDLMTLSARLPKYGAYLTELAELAITDALFGDQCEDLKKLEASRTLVDGMEGLKAKVFEKPFDTEKHQQAVAELQGGFMQIAGGHRMKSLDDALKSYCERLENTRDFKSIPILRGFDKSVFHCGETFVLAGDTGAGKTALVAGSVNLMLDSGLSVLYVCTESSSDDILARIVAARCGVPHYKIINRTATANEHERHLAAMMDMKSRFRKQLAFHCIDGSKLTPSGISESVKRLALKAGAVDVVIVDYLGGVRPDVPVRNGNKTVEVEQIIMALHDVFVDAKAAGLVLCQYSRQGQEDARKGVEPQLNWLRDCGSIEALAHVVAHIVTIPEKDGKQKEFFLVCNQKHRNTEEFCCPLRWTGATYEAMQGSARVDAGDIPQVAF